MKTLKVVGYARVSTMLQIAGKEFDSIEAQSTIIRAYVDKHPEMKLVEIFTDPGKSGKNMNRPGMQAMLRRISQGDIDCVLSYRLDRISRDQFDYFEFERLITDNGVRVIYTNDMNPDNSPFGKFMRILMVALAQLERNQTIQRINDKHVALLKQGYHAGGYSPLGYLPGEKKNTIVIDPVASKHVREMYSLILKGEKPSAVASHMYNKYGNVPTRKSRNGREYGGGVYTENFVRKILANPVYAGYVHRNRGAELYDGLHEAIVNRDDWAKVQQMLMAPRKAKVPEIRAGKNIYVLKGKLFCGCGSIMTCGASGKPKKDGSFNYYICSARNHKRIGHRCQSSISTKTLDAIVFSALGYVATKGLTVGEIKSSSASYGDKLAKERKELAEKRHRLNEKLKNIVAKYAELEGNDVLKDAIAVQTQKLSNQVESLDKRIADIDADQMLCENKVDFGTVQTKSFLDNMDALQAELSDEEKRAVVEAAIEKVTLEVKSAKGRRREFQLTIVPSGEYMGQIGILNLEIELFTGRGFSEWKIKSPFILTSESYGRKSTKGRRKQKRHWLHKVVAWRNEIERGATLGEIAAKENLGRSMVCRKLKLLERLNPKIVEKILKIRYADQTDKLTFRFLDNLASRPKNQQLIECGF